MVIYGSFFSAILNQSHHLHHHTWYKSIEASRMIENKEKKLIIAVILAGKNIQTL